MPASANPALSAAVRALTDLPADQQAVYRARYVAEETPAATCERLGIDQGAYDARLAKALRTLRKMTMREMGACHG